MSNFLEAFKELTSEEQVYFSLGAVSRVEESGDRSQLRLQVGLIPDEIIIMAKTLWPIVGPGSGFYQYPQVKDLVLVCFIDGDPDQAYVIGRLSSREDHLPVNAKDGHTVLKALAEKNLWLTGKRINLSKGDAEPDEALPLGNVLQTLLSSLITQVGELADAVRTHTHLGGSGAPVGQPMVTDQTKFSNVKTAVDGLKDSPVDDGAMLSETVYTEK